MHASYLSLVAAKVEF